MNIRKAGKKDIPAIMDLLSQVLEIHASVRPDIFRSGTTKYSRDDLVQMFADDSRPVYVATDEKDNVLGYAFCIVRDLRSVSTMHPHLSMFIDDLCVNERARGIHIGETLFNHVKQQAKALGCRDITLNVWEGNDGARHFYDKMGMKVRETNMEIML